jgi:thiamine kinase-like enzyme
METRQKKTEHQQEVEFFLQSKFHSSNWHLDLPGGTGNETYFAHSHGQSYFVKLGVHLDRYISMDSIGLIPHVLVSDFLEDGTSIVVQPVIEGKNPDRKDYRTHLEKFATTIDRMHHSFELRNVLPPKEDAQFSSIGLETLTSIQERWQQYRDRVPDHDEYIEESLCWLNQQVNNFTGEGLISSHNDICNANWLVTQEGRIYILDLESMSLDDPALDIGATLWWYYPPSLRPKFLEIVGYAGDESFQHRMQVRMAMHCLNIALPRKKSFDCFNAGTFTNWLNDFKAVRSGKENPQGYEE